METTLVKIITTYEPKPIPDGGLFDWTAVHRQL